MEIFEAETQVLVAYLFGSKARGVKTSQSDNDIAILLSELPENLLDFYLNLIDKLSKVIGDAVDLVVLNTAAPLLKHQVIKHGRVIYCRDEKSRVEFESGAEKEYMDFKIYRERYDEAVIREISTWKD
ncbi:MAG: nucleotidyltransferase domain-containing protein [Anaerolineae bacterium]|nr:nucleotidyltransferase domain-containing protein [Anaerolineae bacterium]